MAALAFGVFTRTPESIRNPDRQPRFSSINLTIDEVLAEMVDLVSVPMWAFGEKGLGPQIPGPTIVAVEGDLLSISILNNTLREHAFSIPGIQQSSVIRPGEELSLSLRAPQTGTYLYLDPINAPVNRVMGLHGALIVLPRTGNTPYSNPTPRVQALFNDLGTTGWFPGSPWNPERTWVWVFNTIDPTKFERAQDQPTGDALSPAEFANGYLPRYFTVNGKSGYFAAHDPNLMPKGKVGQPGLIRILNSGMATHSAHLHGNHVFLLSENGRVRENVVCVDTFAMPSGGTKDILLPFVTPPDIPPGAWPPSQESLPFHYPMHCHTQMSQTAAGGNYPQGLNVHWMLLPG
jgi:FtsP/CotA-like multicopper oxidase with cupredoxin domain